MGFTAIPICNFASASKQRCESAKFFHSCANPGNPNIFSARQTRQACRIFVVIWNLFNTGTVL